MIASQRGKEGHMKVVDGEKITSIYLPIEIEKL